MESKEQAMQAEIVISISTEIHIGMDERTRQVLSDEGLRRVWEEQRDYALGLQMLSRIAAEAGGAGVEVKRNSQRYRDDNARHFDGGITHYISETLVALGGLAGIAAVIKSVQPILVQWLKNKGGRKIEIKVGESHIKIEGDVDIQRFLVDMERRFSLGERPLLDVDAPKPEDSGGDRAP